MVLHYSTITYFTVYLQSSLVKTHDSLWAKISIVLFHTAAELLMGW